eukprot:1505915-Amphidinium_carterae.1
MKLFRSDSVCVGYSSPHPKPAVGFCVGECPRPKPSSRCRRFGQMCANNNQVYSYKTDQMQ